MSKYLKEWQMVQRDFVKEQIEEAGRVLGKILADFLGLSNDENVFQAIETINEKLSKSLDINVADLMKLDEQALEVYLKKRHISSDSLDELAHYYYEAGLKSKEFGKEAFTQEYLKLSQKLLFIIEKMTDTITLERMVLKSKITRELVSKD